MSARKKLPPHVQVLGDDSINLPKGDIRPRMRTRLTQTINTPHYRDRIDSIFGPWCLDCKRCHKGDFCNARASHHWEE